MPQCALQSLSYHSKETIAQAMALERERILNQRGSSTYGKNSKNPTLFDLASSSVDEELESKVMLWRYVQS